MGIDPEWLGYVKYCGELHLGQFDDSKIDVIGAKVADVKKAVPHASRYREGAAVAGPHDGVALQSGLGDAAAHN